MADTQHISELRGNTMPHNLLIVGAGGFGREVLAWTEDIPEESRNWRVAGFLDKNPQTVNWRHSPLPVMGDPDTYLPAEGDRFICAIGDPATRWRLCDNLRCRGAKFINLIHPTAVVGPDCQLGEGTILCPYAVLTVNVTLGDFVVLNLHATVGHNARIGHATTLSCHSDVTGYADVGDQVLLGSHATVLPSVVVGNHATIGAGSVAVRRVRANSTVVGVPAKRLQLSTLVTTRNDAA
jgi:sugar O-acyltransferase (sialic acid O-acetyltransferase NeuD family)